MRRQTSTARGPSLMWKAGSSANQIAFYPRRKNRMACAQMLSGAIVAVSVAQPVPLISNNCATSSRNGPSRCLKDAASPIRRCCANLANYRDERHVAGPSFDERAQTAFEDRRACALVSGRTAASSKTPALREPSQQSRAGALVQWRMRPRLRSPLFRR